VATRVPERSIEIIARVYNALGDPVRRHIIQILQEKGKAGFRELRDALRLTPESLFRMLNTLEGIITQDKDENYLLSDEGRSALEAVRAGNAIETGPDVRETRPGFLTRELLFARSIFQYLNRAPFRALPLAIAIVSFGGWVSSQTNLEPLLLFYVNPPPGPSRAWFLLMFPLGWLATFAAAEVLSITIFHRRGGELRLLNGTAFALLPLLIVPVLSLAQFFSVARTAGYVVIVLPVILQAWVACLLSSCISIAKGLKMERTALVSLGIMYLNTLVVLTSLELGLF
jgi:hypothetical protein